MTTRNAHADGFTLLELLVVISIIGLVSSLALPCFTQALPGVELKQAARDLAATLRTARGDAIKTNGEVTVFLGKAQDLTPEDPGTTTWELPDGLALERSPKTPVHSQMGFRFFPDGSSDSGLVTLSRGERRFRIAVDWLTGGIKTREQ